MSEIGRRRVVVAVENSIEAARENKNEPDWFYQPADCWPGCRHFCVHTGEHNVVGRGGGDNLC